MDSKDIYSVMDCGGDDWAVTIGGEVVGPCLPSELIAREVAQWLRVAAPVLVDRIQQHDVEAVEARASAANRFVQYLGDVAVLMAGEEEELLREWGMDAKPTQTVEVPTPKREKDK